MKLIPYGKQYIDKQDEKIVLNSLRQNLITNGGIYQNKLETKVKKLLNCKYVVSCSSGTAAIHLALQAINCNKGDNIIMPAINFISSYNISKLMKLNIYLADVNEITGQVTNETIEKCIKENKLKKIKAIIVMYLGGYTFNIPKIYKLKKKYKCFLIEDSCHALGSSYTFRNREYMVGSCKHSDISTFSMHPVKSITSGEGGILTTNNKAFFNTANKFKSHNLIKNSKKYWDYSIKEPGLNYRLSDINCALAYSQLSKIKKFLNKRNQIYKFYERSFKKIDNKILNFIRVKSHTKPSFHLFVILINFNKLNCNKERLIKFLINNDIVTQYHYIPIYKFEIAKNDYNSNNFIGAEKYYQKSLSIPIYYDLKQKEQIKIIKKILYFINQNYEKN